MGIPGGAATDVLVDARQGVRRVPAGTVVVKTAQPLGSLAAYLLHERSEDGLTAWGFFARAWLRTSRSPSRPCRSCPRWRSVPMRPLPERAATNKPITERLLFGRGFGELLHLVSPVRRSQRGAWVDGDDTSFRWKDGKLVIEGRSPHRQGRAVRRPHLRDQEIARGTQGGSARGRGKTRAPTSFHAPSPAHRVPLRHRTGSRPRVLRRHSRGAAFNQKQFRAKDHVESFSPDGKNLAFVHGREDLYVVVDVEKHEEKQLTTDGGGDIFNAKGDWVYEEGKSSTATVKRTGEKVTGRRAAPRFCSFDDTPVKKFNLVDLSASYGRIESCAYPKPGDPNPRVKIGVVSADGGKPTFLDMGAYKTNETIVARVRSGWRNRTRCSRTMQNRTQTWLGLRHLERPRDAEPKKLFRETTKAWVEDLGEPHIISRTAVSSSRARAAAGSTSITTPPTERCSRRLRRANGRCGRC